MCKYMYISLLGYCWFKIIVVSLIWISYVRVGAEKLSTRPRSEFPWFWRLVIWSDFVKWVGPTMIHFPSLRVHVRMNSRFFKTFLTAIDPELEIKSTVIWPIYLIPAGPCCLKINKCPSQVYKMCDWNEHYCICQFFLLHFFNLSPKFLVYFIFYIERF